MPSILSPSVPSSIVYPPFWSSSSPLLRPPVSCPYCMRCKFNELLLLLEGLNFHSHIKILAGIFIVSGSEHISLDFGGVLLVTDLSGPFLVLP
jgi:hypothetical protein